jgi:GGDEF domain-containing protein
MLTGDAPSGDPLDALEISLRRLRVMLCIGYGIAAVQSDSGSAFDRRSMLAVGVVIALLLSANVYGLVVERRPTERRVVTAIVVQLGLDTVAGGVASVVLLAHDDGLRWLPLLFPVFAAGLRFRLRGLGLVWGLVTILSLASEFATRPAIDPQAFLTGASLVLVIAAPASYLSQLLFEELQGQAEMRREAQRREQLANVIAETGHRLQSLELDTIRDEVLAGVLAVGFDAAALWEIDAAGHARQVGAASAHDASAHDLADESGRLVVPRLLGDGRAEIALVGYSRTEQHRWAPAAAALETLASMCASATDAARAHQDIAAMQRRLRYDATHDALTGILNRAGFEDEIAAVAAAGHDASVMGLVFCDLDEFKAVNDRLGHRTGDRVLAEVARRLLASVAQLGGIPARLGGDEFVVLLRAGRPAPAGPRLAVWVHPDGSRVRGERGVGNLRSDRGHREHRLHRPGARRRRRADVRIEGPAPGPAGCVVPGLRVSCALPRPGRSGHLGPGRRCRRRGAG